MNIVALGIQQHHVLRQRILEEEPDIDERTLADTLEGLTDLHQTLAIIVRAALDDESLGTALRERIATMESRLQRIEDRAARRRAMVREAMIAADIKKLSTDDLTLSLRLGSKRLVVTDETMIPSCYWEPKPPRLDRISLLAALKQGSAIPGANLAEAEVTLSVRTK